MASERIDPEFRDAVVTYSRLPSRDEDFESDVVAAGRREPTLDAAEIHVLDPHDDVDRGFAVRSERRGVAEDIASPADLGLEEKRSPVTRIVFATAALAIVVGVGVLAATVGIATLTPSRTPVETAASAPPVLAAVDPEAVPSSGVREIPLATESAAVAPKDVAPPVPRARPEDAAVASVTPKSESVAPKAEPIPAGAPLKPTVATLPPPSAPVPVKAAPVPVLPPPTAKVTSASADGDNTDALISNIEQTLAKRDNTPMGAPPGTLDPHGMEVLPEGPIAILPPPASMAPGYPSPQSAYPGPSAQGAYPGAGAQGQTYDVLPPAPVTDNGYGRTYPDGAPVYPADAYPLGPMPPAEVPYGYPSRPMDYEVIPEKEPGLLRRTWMRTADAVTRVFSRDDR